MTFSHATLLRIARATFERNTNVELLVYLRLGTFGTHSIREPQYRNMSIQRLIKLSAITPTITQNNRYIIPAFNDATQTGGPVFMQIVETVAPDNDVRFAIANYNDAGAISNFLTIAQSDIEIYWRPVTLPA